MGEWQDGEQVGQVSSTIATAFPVCLPLSCLPPSLPAPFLAGLRSHSLPTSLCQHLSASNPTFLLHPLLGPAPIAACLPPSFTASLPFLLPACWGKVKGLTTTKHAVQLSSAL